MTAREGGTEARDRRGVERGPRTVREVLDRQGQNLFTAEDDDEERENPGAASSEGLDRREYEAEHDDRRDRPELGDETKPVRRQRRAMVPTPASDAAVEPVQVPVRPFEVREHSQSDAAADRQQQRERQRQAGRGVRVQSRRNAA